MFLLRSNELFKPYYSIANSSFTTVYTNSEHPPAGKWKNWELGCVVPPTANPCKMGLKGVSKLTLFQILWTPTECKWCQKKQASTICVQKETSLCWKYIKTYT